MSLPTTYSEDNLPEKIQPEELIIADTYLSTGGSIAETAERLDIPRNEVASALRKRPVKLYVDSVFSDIGYMNRFKMADVFQTLIERKMEELDEAEIGSNKDIVDILDKAMKFMELTHKMQVSETKTSPTNQTNVQIANFDAGDNYKNLLDHLFKNKG